MSPRTTGRGGRPGPARWRGLAIVAVKLVHTAVFALVSTSVLYVFVCGLRGQPARWTGRAILIVLVEAVVFAGGRWHCPLTGLAERLGAERGRVTDIFLPRWFADRIPQIYTPLFVVGLLGLGWRRWRRGPRAAAPDG